jgi:hypothetical protein
LRFFIPPGNVTPPHLHRATDETFLIESGEIEIKQPRASPTRERRDVKIHTGAGSPQGPVADQAVEGVPSRFTTVSLY